jgi:hypothetical protein
MAGVLDRHRDEQHGVVTASGAASLLIHGSLIALGWTYVDGASSLWTRTNHADHSGSAVVVEPSEQLYLVLETTAKQPTVVSEAKPVDAEPAHEVARGGTAQQVGASGPYDDASARGYASDANDVDALPGLPVVERRAAPSPQGLLVEPGDLGRVVAEADIHATVADAPAGTDEDKKHRKDGERGLKGVLKGIGGFLDGIKVSGVGGAGGVAGAGRGPGKGGCVPGVGGIIGRRHGGGGATPQKPAWGPPGIGGPPGAGFEHNSEAHSETCD